MAGNKNKEANAKHKADLRALKIAKANQKLEIQLQKFTSNQKLKEDRWEAADTRRTEQIRTDNAAVLAPLALEAENAAADSGLRSKILPWALGAAAVIVGFIILKKKRGAK